MILILAGWDRDKSVGGIIGRKSAVTCIPIIKKLEKPNKAQPRGEVHVLSGP